MGVVLLSGVIFFGVVPREVAKRMNSSIVGPPYAVSNEAAALHETLFVADLHADSLLWERNLLDKSSYGHVDIPRLVEGNVALQAFTVVTKVPWGINIDSNEGDSDQITLLAVSQRWPVRSWFSLKERALYQARKLHGFSQRSRGDFMLILARPHLETFLKRRERNPNLVGGFLGLEGAHALEGDLASLDELFKAGFRMMGPTHFFDNELGGSAHGMSKSGLTDFGRQAIKRMEELNILVDLAHASPAMIDDILDMATRPVVVSHGGVKGTCDNARNLSDDHIRRIAALGGVIGIGYWETAVCGSDASAVARAILYVTELVGADHVGLGSDYDGAINAFFDTSGVALVTEALLREGFSEGDIRKIMGGNVIRLLLETLPPE